MDWVATNRQKQRALGLWTSQYPKDTDHEAVEQRVRIDSVGKRKKDSGPDLWIVDEFKEEIENQEERDAQGN